MTFMQKILRPALNFLVETFFPEGAFFGRDYLRGLKTDPSIPEKWGSFEMACMMAVTDSLRRSGVTEAKFTASNVTSYGVPQGSWQIEVTKEQSN